MIDDLINIDNYFQQKLSAEEREVFERRLSTDEKFAEDVAFYAQTKAIERENRLKERHSEWINRRPITKPFMSIGRISMSMAAVLALVVGFWYFTRTDINQRADEYISENLITLQSTMDATQDSLQMGVDLYNKKKYKDAGEIFEKLIENNPKAIEYAGLAAFQMQEFDVATIYFEKLEQDTELLENKGKFYQALVYLKQGKTQRAERLLNEVIDQNLGGKKEAEKILE